MTGNLALKIDQLDVFYKDFHALWNVSLEVRQGEIVSIIGANGAGKSTLLNTIAGLLSPAAGTIEFFGEKIGGCPAYDVVTRGLVLVPEGRRVFSRLTVHENLIMGSYAPQTRAEREDRLEKLFYLFPILKERRHQRANTLSGGEQQMLAIARAMMTDPKLILCDEISLGLAPVIIKGIYKRLAQINQDGLTIVLVEQDVKRSLKTAHRAYIMLEGKIVLHGEPSTLTDEQVKKAYFGL